MRPASFNKLLSVLTAVALLFTSSPWYSPIIDTFAAVDTYTVSGGDVGALPDVGNPSVAMNQIVITEDGTADDFGATETIRVAINTAAYPGVQFDNTVGFFDITVLGDCTYDTVVSVVYSSGDQIADIIIDDTFNFMGCTAGQFLTIDGLKVQTTAAAAAPGPAHLISIDNTNTNPGNPINSSTTMNLPIGGGGGGPPADAAMMFALTTPAVGSNTNGALAVVIPANLDAGDYVQFDLPAHINVAGVGFVSTTFGGGGSFNCANTGGPTVRCTSTGSILAGPGGIEMSGFIPQYVATNQPIANGIVFDLSAGSNIATDDTPENVNDVSATDANASVVLTNPAIGAADTTTVTFDLPRALANGDTVEMVFPAIVDISGVAAAVTGTLEATDSVTCSAGGQTLTCTTTAATNTGPGLTIILTGITGATVGATDITSFEVEDGGVAANDIATDAMVPLTDVVAATSTSGGGFRVVRTPSSNKLDGPQELREGKPREYYFDQAGGIDMATMYFTWNEVPNATSYRLYFETEADVHGQPPFVINGISSPSYTYDAFAVGFKYTVEVSALIGLDETARSNTLELTIEKESEYKKTDDTKKLGQSDPKDDLLPVPKTPQNLRLESIVKRGNNLLDVTVMWDKEPNASEYNPFVNIRGLTQVDEWVSDHRVVVSQITAGSTFTSWVRAKNSAGISSWTPGLSLVVDLVGVPENLIATRKDKNWTLSWDKVPGADQYFVLESDDGENWNKSKSVLGAFADFSDISKAKKYYAVQAVKGEMTSTSSEKLYVHFPQKESQFSSTELLVSLVTFSTDSDLQGCDGSKKWDVSASYQDGDVVEYKGDRYFAKGFATSLWGKNTTPDQSKAWEKLSKCGESSDREMAKYDPKCPKEKPFRDKETEMCGEKMRLQETGTSGCPQTAPEKCADNTCRVSASECPSALTNTCPATNPIKCSDGRCMANASECPDAQKSTGCPTTNPHKCDDGKCVANALDCSDDQKTSQCPTSTPFTCGDGRCVAQESDCSSEKTQISCADSLLRLKIRQDDGRSITRDCSWVGANEDRRQELCQQQDFKNACPKTCNACEISCPATDASSDLRFKFEYNGKSIVRNCEFIGRIASKLEGRCNADESIKRICPAACQMSCSDSSSSTSTTSAKKTCPAGFEGDDCTVNIDDCANSLCVNGSVCEDKVNDYECKCPDGFTGKNCETDINECADNPCVRGTCSDMVNGYVCSCPDGFTGSNCQVQVVTNACYCENGVAATGDACSSDGVNLCSSCDEGYELNDDAVCVGQSCRVPFIGGRGVVVDSGCQPGDFLEHDSQCKLSCAPGYDLKGTQPSCFAGVYSNGNIECVPNFCDASTLIAPVNGRLEDCSTLGHGEDCTATCDEGYIKSGVDYSCNDGQLKQSTVQCLPSSCDATIDGINRIEAPVNGVIEHCGAAGSPFNSLEHEEYCTFSCNAGYRLSDAYYDSQFQCLAGTVKKSTVTCQNIDECADELDDCQQTCVDTEGSFICGCKEGYQVDPNDATGCVLIRSSTGSACSTVIDINGTCCPVGSSVLDANGVCAESGLVDRFGVACAVGQKLSTEQVCIWPASCRAGQIQNQNSGQCEACTVGTAPNADQTKCISEEASKLNNALGSKLNNLENTKLITKKELKTSNGMMSVTFENTNAYKTDTQESCTSQQKFDALLQKCVDKSGNSQVELQMTRSAQFKVDENMLTKLGLSGNTEQYQDKLVLYLKISGSEILSKRIDSDGNLVFRTNVIKDFEILPGAPKATANFPDAFNDPESEAIFALRQLGMISGTPDGLFLPNNDLNRAETSKIISNLAGIFPDDPQAGDKWFSAQQRALQNSLITNGMIEPWSVENRINFLALVAKSYNINITTLPACDTQRFTDVAVDAWYCPLVEFAVEAEWVRERERRFMPSRSVSRSWAAGVVWRTMQVND